MTNRQLGSTSVAGGFSYIIDLPILYAVLCLNEPSVLERVAFCLFEQFLEPCDRHGAVAPYQRVVIFCGFLLAIHFLKDAVRR